jgi:phosphoserine phosphatase RsbU/P
METIGMRLGLRIKSALALGTCSAVVLALAVLAGWRALRAVEENLGTAFTRNLTRYNQQRILAPVLRELALSQRLADSEVTRRWLKDENDRKKQALFFTEAEHYRRAFADHSYFVISGATHNYYFNDSHGAWSMEPRYALRASNPNDAWFFNTMRNTREFNINVDPDVKLQVTKVWFNVLIKDGTRNIGLAGTGLDLTQFLNRFITNSEAGVTPMILNRKGAIQAHPNRNLIDYSSINNKGAAHSTVYHLLTRAGEHEVLRDALRRAEENTRKSIDSIPVFWAELNGRRQLCAVAFIPELNWFVLTAVDLKAAQVIDTRLWLPPLLMGGALMALLVLAITIAVNRILLSPLLKLTDSARAVAAGNFTIDLPPAGADELGELTRAFGAMASQVQSHTVELETRVRERTQELVAVNQRMAGANKKIDDSIHYASLIQNAILPDHELARDLAGQYFVLWRPRDVVGGDFYVFRAADHGCLLGVVDCAGHGVPGAFMTMMAHTVISVAMDALGLSDPAAILTEVDARTRAMLTDANADQIVTHMDAGLVYADFKTRAITFAGAKISLHWCDGENVGNIKGDRCAIGDRRGREFSNKTMPLNGRKTFYLTTDGLLDQAGGPKGYSFGQARFEALLRQQTGRSFAEQRAAFAEELAAYQGDLEQRDDITVLSFRFTPS